MIAVAAIAVALLAGVDWWAVWRGRTGVEQVAKPLVMVALAGLALALGARDIGVGRWLLVAIGFGLVGDLFLLGRSTARFFGGLVAFFLGHVAYVIAFRSLGVSPILAAISLVVVIPLLLTSGRRILWAAGKEAGLGLGAAVGSYVLVIATMVLTAAGTGRPLVAAGAVVFLVSDTVLALDRFVGPRANARLVVMTTYHVGQVLIVLGALR